MTTRHDLIAALRLRYDHYSAQTMFDAARDRAGLADRPGYEPGEVAAWRAGLAAIGDRLDSVWTRLDALGETAPVVAAKPAAVAETKPAAVAETKPAAVAETKPAAVAETKPAAVAETKPAAVADVAVEPDERVETTIGVTGVTVEDGEEVLICGGLGELGDWDPARARPMSREGDGWRTTLAIPATARVAFKFLRRAPDGTVVWEGGEDRDLVAKPRIDAVWR